MAAPVPPTTRTVQGDGVALAVREWGAAAPGVPTVLLVHGFPDSSTVWDLVAEALVDHGAHVVAYDVRGCGASEAPEGVAGYRLEHLTSDALAVVDAVSPDRPVHLVGHDWGSVQGWEFACAEELRGRLASFTSISGPALDHCGAWLRARSADRAVGTLAKQAVRSSYVAVFHTPGVRAACARFSTAVGRSRRAFGRSVARAEGARTDDAWPAPTFGRDLANGMQLYRANVGPRLREPRALRAHVPVQLVVPVQDRFVPSSFLEGIEALAPDLRRRRVDAAHWVVRSQPVDVAVWVMEHVEDVAGVGA